MVEVHAGHNFDSDDRRRHPVDDEAERRPPTRVGDELTAVLPQVLQPMAGEADDEQPSRAGGANSCGSLSAGSPPGAPDDPWFTRLLDAYLEPKRKRPYGCMRGRETRSDEWYAMVLGRALAAT
jgi:hypothetical protein